MNEGESLPQMLSIIRHFEFECRHVISAWTLNSQFVILGTISGSLLYHQKSNPVNREIVAFAELMDTITTIRLVSNRTNDLIIGTKKGILSLVQVKNVNHKIIDQHYQSIAKFDEDVIEIFAFSNQAWIVCTSQKVMLIKYQTDLEGMIKVREKKVLFEPEGQIMQVNRSEEKLLVSTWKSYFALDLKTNEAVQIGSKEKQGIYGAAFIQDEVYAARPFGRIWKANSATGKVLNTLQFFSENGDKLGVGLLKDFAAKCIVSYNNSSKNLTVFDCRSNEILREENFSNDFLLLFDQNCVSKNFYVLLQEQGRVLIKCCSLKAADEAFNDCFEFQDVDEAIKILLKHEKLWSKKNIEKIFEHRGHLQNQNLLDDPRFINIIEIQLDEEVNVAQICFEDFDNVEHKLPEPESTKFEIQGIETEKKVLNFENFENNNSQLCSTTTTVELGKEFALKSQAQIRKQTKRIRNLRNRANERIEFICLLESLGIENQFATKLEKEKLYRILNRKTPFYFGLSQQMIFYCAKSLLFAEGSLTNLEQINIKYRKEVRLNFIKGVMAQLLFKKHIFGFLNRVERKYLQELVVCFQKSCCY